MKAARFLQFGNSNSFILGFGAILTLVLVTSILSAFHINKLKNDIQHIVNNNLKKTQLVTTMRIAARERTLLLYQMLSVDDVFLRDEMVGIFHAHGRRFAESREELQTLLGAGDKGLYEKVIANMRVVIDFQLEVIDLAIQENDEAANRILNKEVNERQAVVVAALDELLAFQQNNAVQMFAEATQDQVDAKKIILSTTLLIIGLGTLIAFVVIRIDKRAKQALHDLNASLEIRVKERTAEVEKEKNKVGLILGTVKDAIVTCDNKGVIETFNPGAVQVFGYSSKEAIGQSISILMTKELAKSHDAFFNNFISANNSRSPLVDRLQIGRRKNGDEFPIEISLNNMFEDGVLKITALMRDVTERVKQEEKIKQLAMSDSLTGLANRNEFNKKILEAIALSKRSKKSFALLQIDLDKFKHVNDTYGHPFGDQYLIQVAEILRSSVREVDTVARIGGDEFSAILLDVEITSQADVVVNRILNRCKEQYTIDGVDINIGLSIGISFYVHDVKNVEELIKNADEALYQAKNDNRQRYYYYNDKAI